MSDSVEVLWYLTAPDGRHPWTPDGTRKIDLPYLRQIAGAVDQLGYTGALLATGPHDTWVLGSSLITATERLRFLIAVHPPLISPVPAAKMAVTFDQFSNGRIILNIVNGTSGQLRAFGSTLEHDERYAHTDEWIPVWRAAAAGEPLDFAGRYITAQGSPLPLPSVQKPAPPLWFGGSSPAALRTAAKHIDTYLSWGEPPPQTAEKIGELRAGGRAGALAALRHPALPDRPRHRRGGVGGGRPAAAHDGSRDCGAHPGGVPGE